MLFCFGLFALLLYNTVVANAVCSFTYSKKDKIDAVSFEYQKKGYRRCEYVIEAPKDSDVIQLNFTDLIGFQSLPTGRGSSEKFEPHTGPNKFTPDTASETTEESDEHCLPPELIITDTSLGEKKKKLVNNKICKTSNYKTPQVFQYKTDSLKIIYVWKPDEHSGFTLDLDFQNCAFDCDESKCFPDDSLKCNQVFDCVDRSDEQNCPVSQTLGASLSVSQIIVIIVIVVLMPVLAVFICVVSPCRSTSRMWRRFWSRDRGTDVQNRQLRPRSQGSEVLFVPAPSSSSSAAQDNLEQKEALLHERKIIVKSPTADMEISLPPHIPISLDGEEGYVRGQKSLANHRTDEIYQQCFRPPPNKTVYDKESPPPYFSRSVSSLDSLGHSPIGHGSMGENVSPNRGDVTLQCYSVSANNNHFNNSCFPGDRTNSHSNSNAIRHTRYHSDVRSSGLRADRPPDYHQVCNINTYNTSEEDDKV